MAALCGVVVRARSASIILAALSLVLASSVFAESPESKSKANYEIVDGCSNFGTAINWVASPKEAAELARKESKLLMVMQLSGNFAKEAFT
jgi:hypothetical protein